MSFPTGDETGTYLALDMGGTNLRVCEVDLSVGKGEFEIVQSKYRLPEELKTGTAGELWAYIADCVQQFVAEHHAGEELCQMHLGFTFSYPVTQDYINHGVLQRWTKGFDIDGVEGHDVVPMFEAALAERVGRESSPIFFLPFPPSPTSLFPPGSYLYPPFFPSMI
jgi:hexokinase